MTTLHVTHFKFVISVRHYMGYKRKLQKY